MTIDVIESNGSNRVELSPSLSLSLFLAIENISSAVEQREIKLLIKSCVLLFGNMRTNVMSFI